MPAPTPKWTPLGWKMQSKKKKKLDFTWQQYIAIMKLSWSCRTSLDFCLSLSILPCIWFAVHSNHVPYTLHHGARNQSMEIFPLTSVGVVSKFSLLNETESHFSLWCQTSCLSHLLSLKSCEVMLHLMFSDLPFVAQMLIHTVNTSRY